MRRTALLAFALLGVAACNTPPVTVGNMCWDGCGGGGGGPIEPWTTASIIGFPLAKVDSTGTPRLTVGDSVALYAVRHLVTDDPCASKDTLHSVSWSSLDSTVLRARGAADGHVTVHAVKPGLTSILGETPELHVGGMFACRGTSRVYLGLVRVDSAATP